MTSPDVVERTADFGEQLVGADGLRGVIGELTDLDAVVVSAFGFVIKPVQQRMIHGAELMERDRRDDVEEAFAQGGQEEEGDDDDEAVGESHQEKFDPEMRQLDGFIRVEKRVEQTGPFVPCIVFGNLPEEIQGEQHGLLYLGRNERGQSDLP